MFILPFVDMFNNCLDTQADWKNDWLNNQHYLKVLIISMILYYIID